MIFGKKIVFTNKINTEPSSTELIKILFTGYCPKTSAVPDPRIKYSRPSDYLSSTTAYKRLITGKNSRQANAKKTMNTELTVTTPNVNKGILFSIF